MTPIKKSLVLCQALWLTPKLAYSRTKRSHLLALLLLASIFFCLVIYRDICIGIHDSIQCILYIFNVWFPIGILRLGFVSVYMSEQFLNGFTCAVAYHVLVSQLQHMLGLPHSDPDSDQFLFFQYLSHIVHHIAQINVVSLSISLVTVLIILISKLYIDPWIVKHSKMEVNRAHRLSKFSLHLLCSLDIFPY